MDAREPVIIANSPVEDWDASKLWSPQYIQKFVSILPWAYCSNQPK